MSRSTPFTSQVLQSNFSTDSLYQVDLTNPKGEIYQDVLAEELPLSLIIQGVPYAIFMRTPGADLELIYGFLLTESIIEELIDVKALIPCESAPLFRIHLTLEAGVKVPPRADRSFISSSCGLCSLSHLNNEMNFKSLIQDPHWKPHILSEIDLQNYLTQFNRLASIYSQTGGAHLAALFTPQGEVRYHCDDIGRHNAVDKVIGAALMGGELSLSSWTLMVSSRAGFEIVTKAISAEVGALVTLGAASGAAHRAAVHSGLPLYSFVRPHRAHLHTQI